MIYPLVQPLVLLVMFVSVFGNLDVTGARRGGERNVPPVPDPRHHHRERRAHRADHRARAAAGREQRPGRPVPLAADVARGRARRAARSDAIVFAVQAACCSRSAFLGFHVRGGLFAAIVVVTVAFTFGVAFAALSAWLGLLINDPETAERVLFFPAIALAFISSAFAPVGLLAGWMQPIARVNPVSAACAVIRSLASGGSARNIAQWVRKPSDDHEKFQSGWK